MANITLSLSRKIDKETGKSEVLIRLSQGKSFNLRAKSGCFILPKYFVYHVDINRTLKNGIKGKIKTMATIDEAVKHHYVLRESGELVTIDARFIRTVEVTDYEQTKEKVSNLCKFISDACNADQANDKSKCEIKGDWLKNTVDRFNHPEKFTEEANTKTDFPTLAERYLSEKERLSGITKRGFLVLFRTISRYEGYLRVKEDKNYTFDVNTFTADDIKDFRSYMENEKALSDEYPELFSKLLKGYPASMKKGNNKIEERGNNTIVKRLRNLRTFFIWLNENGITSNNPFTNYKKWDKQVYGTPIYITIGERNKIASTPMPTKHLETQRDIFIFHCRVGCRVGDLMKLSERNLSGKSGRILEYMPHKTKDESTQSNIVLVPLGDEAMALIEKYKGVDKKGRLFPFISPQKYNDAIKEIFKIADVTRPVQVRNPLTDEPETRQINEVASSHMARRTFIGGWYRKVKDPNYIGKMSGHKSGSKAFERYRDIDEDMLLENVNLID